MKTSLSTRGYSVYKSSLNQKELDNLKKELTLTPRQNTQYSNVPPKVLELYMEGLNKIYVPKFFGLQHFGLPLTEKIPQGEDIDIHFKGELRKEQEEPRDDFLKACFDTHRRGGILNLSCGSGKCLLKNTKVVMHDGSIKNVQDIIVGDKLKGDDNTCRNVFSTCHGYDKMYKVTPATDFFDAYVVNSSHILSTLENGRQNDISITDFIENDSKGKGYTFSFNYNNIDLLNEFTCEHIRKHIKRESDRYFFLNFYNNFDITTCRSLGYKACLLQDCIIVSKYRCKSYTYDLKIQVYSDLDEYFGFEIDKNRRFVLADCTVTHNTVLALNCISFLKKKTLIVVHKEFLLNQWKERIDEFLPNSRIGLIKAKEIDVENKDIVLASLQSLSMKNYDVSIFAGFGFVIIDEVHRTGTEVFSKVFQKINFKYSLGLSATTTRQDGMSKVFLWYIGSIINRKVVEKDDDVTIKFIKYYDGSDEYNDEVIMYNGKLNVSKMINNITNFPHRVSFIVDNVFQEYCNSERTRRFLILSDRKSHLYSLRDALNNKIESKDDTGFYIGGMKEAQLKESEKKQFILATYSYVSEGFDVKGLDTLVLTSPKSNIEQIVGRILRIRKEERKNCPMVIDIVDDFSIFKNQGKKREMFYKKKRYNVAN